MKPKVQKSLDIVAQGYAAENKIGGMHQKPVHFEHLLILIVLTR